MTERIKKAIDIFLDAINEGTLVKGRCTACAVGNLVAHGLNAKISVDTASQKIRCDKNNGAWSYLFVTEPFFKQKIDKNYLDSVSVVENIQATDFTWQELAQIEYAFETNTKLWFNDYRHCKPEEIRADQIKGLEAVVKVMLQFDDCKDNVKEVFTNKAELIKI